MFLYSHFVVSGGVLPTLQNIKLISHSAILAGGQRWRVRWVHSVCTWSENSTFISFSPFNRNGLAGDGLAYGPLTDLPDWSFAGKIVV